MELAEWVERLREPECRRPRRKAARPRRSRPATAAPRSIAWRRSKRCSARIGALKPKTLAGLAQQMRENLAGLWREPAVQKDKKTNRKTKDIQAEVLRGYSVAQAVLDRGSKSSPTTGRLYLAKAALLHDENNYQPGAGQNAPSSPPTAREGPGRVPEGGRALRRPRSRI